MLKTYDNIKVDIFILEHIVAFASNPNIVREKNICLQISNKLP